MSDQRMNAGDQGSQPDSGSAPNDQVTIDAQGSNRSKAGQGSQPEGSSAASDDLGTDASPQSGDVTEAVHRSGQRANEV